MVSFAPIAAPWDKAGRLNGVKDKAGRVRPGLWKCYSKGCRKQFTVKVGTVFESASYPAAQDVAGGPPALLTARRAISAHQLHRTLEVDYKSAGFWRTELGKRCGTVASPYGRPWRRW